jgi:hypothetical protein
LDGSILMSMVVLDPPERIPDNLRRKAKPARSPHRVAASSRLDAELDLHDVREAERRLGNTADQIKPFRKSR